MALNVNGELVAGTTWIDCGGVEALPSGCVVLALTKAAAVLAEARAALALRASRLADMSGAHRKAETDLIEAERAYTAALAAIRSSK